MIVAAEIIFWSSVLLIGYAYVFYALLLAAFRRIAPPQVPSFTETLPSISIVIAAYNEEQAIKKRIQNCLALDLSLIHI